MRRVNGNLIVNKESPDGWGGGLGGRQARVNATIWSYYNNSNNKSIEYDLMNQTPVCLLVNTLGLQPSNLRLIDLIMTLFRLV